MRLRGVVFNQTIASTLIGLLGINSLAWVPQAFAEEPKVSSPSYLISFDVPDHGVIDLYHNAYMARDRVANSLYLLRNTAVEDLLNTRRSLKVLLGGTDRARQVSGKNALGFDVPGGIVDLYLLGQLGADATSGSDQNSTDGSLHATSSSHGIDVETVPEIANGIHWLGGHEPAYNENLRLRMLMGLAYISAQLTKFDQQLKFIQDDFWLSPPISADFYKEEIEPIEKSSAMAGGMVGVDSFTLNTLKHLWLKRHQMQDAINVLAGHREYLLDRYHLLGVEIEGQPLYRLIYKAMQPEGFPAADLIQPAVDAHLPQDDVPIQLPTSFEKSVEEAMTRMADPARKAGILSDIYKASNHSVDLALIESLNANTDRLASLASKIEFDGDSATPFISPSPLAELSKYDDLWEATISKYGYLMGIVDLNTTRAEAAHFWESREANVRHLRYTAYGIGIGIGIAAMVFSGGTAAEAGGVAVEGAEATAATLNALGIPLRSWLIGAGMVADAGLSSALYVDSSEAAKVSKGLYLGTVHESSNADMNSRIEMKDSDFHLMIGSLLILGLSSVSLVRMAVARAMVVREGVAMVEVTEEDLTVLRKAVAEISENAEKLAPMGRALLATVENMLGMAVGESKIAKLQELSEAVNALAKETRLSPATIYSKLESAPGLGRLIKGWRARQLTSRIVIATNTLKQLLGDTKAIVPGTFNSTMVGQQVNNFVISVVAEGVSRGNKMLHEEKGEFIGDMIRGTLITAVLTMTGASGNVAGAAEDMTAAANGVKVVGGFTGGPWAKMLKEAKEVGKAGATNASVGMIINAVSDGTSQAIQYVKAGDTPGAPTAEERIWRVARGTAWNGLSLGISSTLRYRYFCRWAEKYIAGKVMAGAGRTILIQSAFSLNNFVGGWSYVTAGQYLGLLDSAGNKVPDEGEGPDSNADISTIQIGNLTGGYFKVTGDSTAESYMFDFLSGGPAAAGPEPVIQ